MSRKPKVTVYYHDMQGASHQMYPLPQFGCWVGLTTKRDQLKLLEAPMLALESDPMGIDPDDVAEMDAYVAADGPQAAKRFIAAVEKALGVKITLSKPHGPEGEQAISIALPPQRKKR